MRTYKVRILTIVLSSIPIGIIGGLILKLYSKDGSEAWIVGVVGAILAFFSIHFWANKGE